MRDPDLHQAKNWIRILFDLICKYIYIYIYILFFKQREWDRIQHENHPDDDGYVENYYV